MTTIQAPWLYAVDATHTSSSLDSYEHGFQSSLKVTLPNVLTTFFARLAPRGSTEDPHQETKGFTQTWDVMHSKAKFGPGKCYPPMGFYNRDK